MAVPSNQHGADIVCRVIFFIEIAINFYTIPQCFFTPEKFVAMFIPAKSAASLAPSEETGNDASASKTDMGPVVKGFVPWYGVLLTVLTYGELRALIMYNDAALTVIQEAMLLGDFLHIYAAYLMAKALGGWSGSNIAGVVIALFLAGWRIYFIQLMYRYELQGSMQDWFSSS